MSVNIVSTTDSDEAVLSAIGSKLAKNNEADETKSASSKDAKASKQDETAEDSETSENAELEDSDSSESTDDEDLKDESKDDQKPKKKGGFQKRIERFQKKISEKDQEVEYWKREALKGKSPDKAEPETQFKAKPTDAKPKAESFETHEEYVDALTDWKLEQKEKERAAKAEQAQIKNEREKQVQSFQSKVSEFQKSHDDFDEVVAEVDDIPLSMPLQEAIVSSDIGPQVMYELAKDRDELERINRLSPIAAAREIGKIEARLAKESSSAKETTEKKITKAPPPIAPVGSKGSAKTIKSPDDMSFSEYKKWRESNK